MSQTQENLSQFDGALPMTSVPTAGVAEPAPSAPLGPQGPGSTSPMMQGAMGADETFGTAVEEPQAGAGEKLADSARKFGQGNILLVVMLVFAAGGLYLLRQWKASPASASAETRLMEATVDSAILQMDQAGASAKAADVEKVVSAFYTRAERRQIAPEDLGRNPFQFRAGLMPPAPSGKSGPAEAKGPPPPPEVQDLKLQFVLISPSGRSTAMISSNILTVGQKIRGWTVKEIQLRKVILEYKGKTYELKQEKLHKRGTR